MTSLRRRVLRRKAAILLAVALPVTLAGVVMVHRVAGLWPALALGAVALLLCAAVLLRRWHQTGAVWLARRLDALDPRMEDSAALLFADEPQLSTLQRLQRARLRERLTVAEPELRPGWPWRRIGIAWSVAFVMLLAASMWQPHSTGVMTADAARTGGTVTAIALSQVRIDIEPPVYTRLPAGSGSALDVKAPEGSTLRWRLRFDPAPERATLLFHDGRRVELRHEGRDWVATLLLSASTLYRIELAGASALAGDGLHRLDALADQAPVLDVLEPAKTLSLVEAGPERWRIAFEVADDYGIRDVSLQLTLAQGSGENIAVQERTIALRGEPLDGIRRQRYRHELDLVALGMARGDDLIARVVARDNRTPQPNTIRSAGYILRWPAAASDAHGALEGVVQRVMPAYFRSQRQIIIDSEALLAGRPKLAGKVYLERSDAIGVDQRILRLRYGQFLGEEAATQREPAGHDESDHGANADVVAEYGHVHDIAEAATLLDADTKATLKSALAEMWQAELHLRQGHPELALPYEYRALDFIKQVQQSTRIYLARVGLELPVPDEQRRLSGDRQGVADRRGTLVAATDEDAVIVQLWSALATEDEPDWAAAEHWLRVNEARVPDVLGVHAAIDRVRRDPACLECRKALRGQLWPLLPTPAAAPALRAAPDAAGRAWLDAIDVHTRTVPGEQR
jgi:hypothetical protein